MKNKEELTSLLRELKYRRDWKNIEEVEAVIDRCVAIVEEEKELYWLQQPPIPIPCNATKNSGDFREFNSI